MQFQIRQYQKQHLTCVFVFCLTLLNLPLNQLLAQDKESVTTQIKSAEKTSVDLPPDSKQASSDPKKKKEERPRGLGVMLIIVWLILGTGVAILIFTSLFGHSVRGIIRRPYPPQNHSTGSSPAEPQDELSSKSEPVEEEPPQSENNSER